MLFRSNRRLATTSMVISSVTVVLNIIRNGIFIFGLFGLPAMGIVGAALATVLARAVELAWSFAVTLPKGRIHLRMRYMVKVDETLQRDFWKYTLPVLGNEIVWGGGFTMYTVIMGRLGTDAIAANAIANIIKNLIACFCIGLGSGGGILVGNELGAGRLEMAKVYGNKLCKLAIVSGVASGGLILLLSPLLLQVVQITPEAKRYLMGLLVMCA